MSTDTNAGDDKRRVEPYEVPEHLIPRTFQELDELFDVPDEEVETEQRIVDASTERGL